MNDLILSQMRQRLEILYQMVDELERGGGGGGGDDSYTKAQTDALLALKADKSSTYTKSEVNTALSNKANTDDVNEIFATDDISISEGQSLSSDLADWLRLHKPINLNGNEYYFAEESGVDYIYKAIDEAGLLPRFSTVQIMKAGLTVHFYEIDVDVSPTEDSIDLITSGAVYTALSGKQATLTSTQLAAVNSGITSTDVAQIETNKNKINQLGYSIETVNFNSLPAGTSWIKTSGGFFYTSPTIDVSDKFSVIYSATLNDFGNTQGNIVVVPFIKPGTARFGLWVVDPTNPQTLPMIAGTNVKVALFGVLK